MVDNRFMRQPIRVVMTVFKYVLMPCPNCTSYSFSLSLSLPISCYSHILGTPMPTIAHLCFGVLHLNPITDGTSWTAYVRDRPRLLHNFTN